MTEQAKSKMIIAMVAFGTIGLFVKNIPLTSGEIALFRGIIAIIVIFIYQMCTGKKMQLAVIKKDLPLLFISGAAMGFNWILLFEAYRYTTVSIATLSYYFAPVIVIIVCPILFRERLTIKQIICFIMATIGMVLIIDLMGAGVGSNHFIGVCLGLGAAVLYATVVIINKFIKNVTGIDRTLLQFSAAVITLIPYVALTEGIHLEKAGWSGIANLLIVGIVHTGMMYCFYFSSLKDLKGQEAAILSYIDPLTAVVVSVLILRENISVIQIIGGVLILGFTLLNEMKGEKG